MSLSVVSLTTPGVRTLFSGFRDTLVKTALDGIWGHTVADDTVHPTCARLISADFTFLAGDAHAPDAVSCVRDIPWDETKGYTILTPPDAAWEDVIMAAYSGIKPWTRYAIRHEPDVFDDNRLQSCVDALPEPYKLDRITERLYIQSFGAEWSEDFCGNFHDYDDYAAHGIGYAATLDGRMVAGASSYSYYNGGVEIEVDTREDHRRRGLALACCAKLILDCRKRGLYASWDAANRGSVALAEKLGYHELGAYTVYFIKPGM